MPTEIKNYYLVIFFASLFPYLSIFPFIPNLIGGFNLTGWSWIICTATSFIVIVKSNNISFPIWIWLPWSLYLVIYIVIDFSFFGLQLTLQYIEPILVGIAASSFVYTENILFQLFRWFKELIVLIIAITLYKYLFMLPDSGASLVMLIVLASVILLSIYFQSEKQKTLFYYGFLTLIPLILITRMGIAMVLLIAPLHFGNRKIITRIVLGAIIFIAGIIIFNSPFIQKKMFLNGSGTMTELFTSDANLNTNGRSNLAKLMADGLKAKPVWGNGPRSDLPLFQENGLWIKEAHNDYLSVRYNYGWVGLMLLLLAIFLQFIIVYNVHNKYEHPYTIVLITSILTLFIPLLGFMYSDNILKYSISFGNFHFAMIGILFSIINNQKQSLSCIY